MFFFTRCVTLWLFNIAMENCPFTEVYLFIAWWIFPWRTVSHNQMVSVKHVQNSGKSLTNNHLNSVCEFTAPKVAAPSPKLQKPG